MLHDARAAAAAVAAGGSPDAGFVSVKTGLEPAQLHRVLVALVTPIAVVRVGRLAKSGGCLRPTKRNGALALHAAGGGGVKLTWLGESTVPGAAAASLGMRAKGTALAAAARNTVLPVTLATVEPPPPPPSRSDDDDDGGGGGDAALGDASSEPAAGAGAAKAKEVVTHHPRIQMITTDPSGRSFRLIIPPKTKGGNPKELLLYLRRDKKNLGGGGGGGGSYSGGGRASGAATAAAAGTVTGTAAAAAGGMLADSCETLERLKEALASPPSLASRANLPNQALAALSESVTPGIVATLMPGAVCAHCHSALLAGLPGCLVCPSSPF